MSTRAELLAPKQRWGYARKLKLCAGLAAGLVTMAEARATHGLSTDEINAWMAAYVRGGGRALRIYPPRREHSAARRA